MGGLLNDTARDVIAIIGIVLAALQTAVVLFQLWLARGGTSANSARQMPNMFHLFMAAAMDEHIRWHRIIMFSGFTLSLVASFICDFVPSKCILILRLLVLVGSLAQWFTFFLFLDDGDVAARKAIISWARTLPGRPLYRPHLPWNAIVSLIGTTYTFVVVFGYLTVNGVWLKHFTEVQLFCSMFFFMFLIPNGTALVKELWIARRNNRSLKKGGRQA